MKILVGHCGVDSGMIMIVDPCYLHDVHRYKKLLPNMIKNNFLNLMKSGKTDMENKKDYENMNRFCKSKQEAINITENWKGVCTDQEKNSEPKEYASGVLSHTRGGDGVFPVYAYLDKENRVAKLEIVF